MLDLHLRSSGLQNQQEANFVAIRRIRTYDADDPPHISHSRQKATVRTRGTVRVTIRKR